MGNERTDMPDLLQISVPLSEFMLSPIGIPAAHVAGGAILDIATGW
jgi:hypothetical protein